MSIRDDSSLGSSAPSEIKEMSKDDIDELRFLFSLADTDGTGGIQKEELMDLLARLGVVAGTVLTLFEHQSNKLILISAQAVVTTNELALAV
jgi:Ca2+-binding EF-hand superfamily protein